MTQLQIMYSLQVVIFITLYFLIRLILILRLQTKVHRLVSINKNTTLRKYTQVILPAFNKMVFHIKPIRLKYWFTQDFIKRYL